MNKTAKRQKLNGDSNNNAAAKSASMLGSKDDDCQEVHIVKCLVVEMNPSTTAQSRSINVRNRTPIQLRPSSTENDISNHSVKTTQIKGHHSQRTGKPINIESVKLPSLAWSWIFVENPNSPMALRVMCAENVYIAGRIHVRRSVEIDLLNGIACFFLFGALLPLVSFKTTFSSEEELSDMLRCYGNARLCPGYPISQFLGMRIQTSLLGYQDGEVLRSSKCAGTELNSKPCIYCQSMKHTVEGNSQKNQEESKE